MKYLRREIGQSPGRALTAMLRRAQVTREDLAEQLGVSVDTVDNWCRDRSGMRLGHFGRLLSLFVEKGVPVKEIRGFMCDVLAKSDLSIEASQKLLPPTRELHQDMVILVVPNSLWKGVRLITAGAREHLRDMGIGLLVVSANDGVPLLGPLVGNMVLATDPLGIIVCGDVARDVAKAVIDAAAEKDTPVVGVAVEKALQADVAATVRVDNFAIGYEAGKYFVARKHKRVGVLGAPDGPGNPQSQRLGGFCHALREAGLGLTPDAVFSAPIASLSRDEIVTDDLANWWPVADGVLRQLWTGELTGVFCMADAQALALWSRSSQLALQSDTSGDPVVVAITAGRWAESAPKPSIAYFSIPVFEMGRLAARLIELLASTGARPLIVRDIELPCELRISDPGGARRPSSAVLDPFHDEPLKTVRAS
ncbi:MAG: substrate-binding domain-containing protein [Chloroflexota bacterium]|nr:substrate-binding domain-containing protein [Chloroflexota bacterium]